MPYFEKNLDFMKEQYSDLRDAIQTRKDGESKGTIQCFVQEAKDGSKVLGVQTEEKKYYMGSRYNPTGEAERFAKKYETVTDFSSMVFVGLGSGVLAKKVIESLGEHVQYLFYEPSVEIFLQVLHYFDMGYLLTNPRTAIVVKGLNDAELDIVLGNIVTEENYRKCYIDALPVYRQLFPEDYQLIENEFSFTVNAVYGNIVTKQRFAVKATHNIIANMKEVFHSNCEMELAEVLPTDRPAIVVSAGPSLEKNVEYLKDAKGKMLIVAVDTALQYLVERGIQPDLAITVDPAKWSGRFVNEKTRQIPLAIYSSSNNDIVQLLHNEKIIFVSAECAYYNKMYELANRYMFSYMTGGSVATCAVTMVVGWGYKKIILVGQDLALDTKKVHAGVENATLYEQKMEDKIAVEGYNGGTVYTSPDYDYYRKWYEFYIRNNKDIEIINATEGGAKIIGAKQIPLKEAIAACDVEQFDFEGTIRNMPPTFNEQNKQEILQLWKSSIEHFDVLKQLLYDGIRQVKYGIRLVTGKRYKVSQIKAIQKKIQEVIENCNSYDEIYFLDSLIARDQADVLGDVFNIREDTDEECCRMFEKMSGYLQAMYDVVEEVKGLFKDVIESVEKDG